MRDSFIFYRSFFEALLGMDKESQADCLMAIADYALNGTEPTLTPAVRLFFTLAKPQLDANNQRFENGKKGGRPKNQTETKTKPNENQTETKPEPNVNENVNVNVNEKEKNTLKGIEKEKIKKFIKPTVEEINTYCRERQNTISAEQFFNFYESKGWRIGSSPMKDWKAAVRTWEAKERTINAAKGLVKSSDDFWRQLGC